MTPADTAAALRLGRLATQLLQQTLPAHRVEGHGLLLAAHREDARGVSVWDTLPRSAFATEESRVLIVLATGTVLRYTPGTWEDRLEAWAYEALGCTHGASAFVVGGEGTAYCGACEAAARAGEEG